MDFYIGTYRSSDSVGIYHSKLDTGAGQLAEHKLALPLSNAKYLACGGHWMAAVCEDETEAGVCLIRRDEGALTATAKAPQGCVAPCYVAFFGDRLVTANYHEGTVYLYRHLEGTLQPERRLDLGVGAGCHQALLCGRYLLIPCLEQDRVALFDWQNGCAPAGEIHFPAGAGPRHGAVSADGRHLWIVGERDNRLYGLRATGHGFERRHVLELLPPGTPSNSTSAAVRLSPDGRFLTISMRGANLLVTWDITTGAPELLERVSCGGDHPRDFVFTPDGKYLLCANRGSGEVVCFRRNVKSGYLGSITDRVQIAQAVSLVCWEEMI